MVGSGTKILRFHFLSQTLHLYLVRFRIIGFSDNVFNS